MSLKVSPASLLLAAMFWVGKNVGVNRVLTGNLDCDGETRIHELKKTGFRIPVRFRRILAKAMLAVTADHREWRAIVFGYVYKAQGLRGLRGLGFQRTLAFFF